MFPTRSTSVLSSFSTEPPPVLSFLYEKINRPIAIYFFSFRQFFHLKPPPPSSLFLDFFSVWRNPPPPPPHALIFSPATFFLLFFKTAVVASLAGQLDKSCFACSSILKKPLLEPLCCLLLGFLLSKNVPSGFVLIQYLCPAGQHTAPTNFEQIFLTYLI
jgi:hypothetical protein